MSTYKIAIFYVKKLKSKFDSIKINVYKKLRLGNITTKSPECGQANKLFYGHKNIKNSPQYPSNGFKGMILDQRGLMNVVYSCKIV